ncbi:hypothetical protein ACSSV8_001423 [Roseovarius sp. MBR-79]|jgi:hypothetical protein
MKAIDYVVRTNAGISSHGSVPGQDGVTVIPAGSGQEISLNLRQTEIGGYSRDGQNLVISLSDGRIVVLEGYYGAGGQAESRLFISADGYLNEVTLIEGGDGAVYAQYGPTAQWGKWSPDDELIFLGGSDVAAVTSDQDVSMLGAALLGGGGLLGAGAAGAAGLGAAALVGGGGGGGGGGGRERIEPSVNEPGPIVIGGDEVVDPSVTITGRAEPDSEVVVTVGDREVTVAADENGDWVAEFSGGNFPSDGLHDVTVIVTEPDGRETVLDGPAVEIDLTPPAVSVDEGTAASGHVVNLVDHGDGVEIGGTGEAGAAITVVIEGARAETVVGADGRWQVVFDPADVPGGERDVSVEVTARDSFGNSTVVTEQVIIDTVPHPITINGGAVGGDGVVNFTEAAGGVSVTGTSTPGAVVTVRVEGVAREVTTGADGTWTAIYEAGSLPAGEYLATVTAHTVDAAGNESSTSGSFNVDTLVNRFEMVGNPGGADAVINAAEQPEGFVMSGRVEPGSNVVVSFAGSQVTAVVSADGTWTATFGAGQIPLGTYGGEVVAVATDAAGNVSELRQAVSVDTDPNALGLNAGAVGGDGVVNLAETGGSVAVTGTSEPGAVVEVSFAGMTRTVVTDDAGNWTAGFFGSRIARGEYDAPVRAMTVDAAGNRSEVNGTVRIDTEVRDFTLQGTPGGADGVINAAEQGGGFTLNGRVEPGSSVVVSFAGSQVNAVVSADGTWSATFTGAQIPGGTYGQDAVAVATDAAGNTSELRLPILVDTEAGHLMLNAASIGGDGVINAAEADAGVRVTGEADPGARVIVSLDGVEHTVIADGAGRWQSTYASGEITRGTHDPVVTARTVDAAGNEARVEGTAHVDTVVENLSLRDLNIAIGADGRDVINNDIATGGFNVTGTIEPGSRVFITIDGVRHEAVVDAAGNWTARFGPGEIASGERVAGLLVEVTDRAGNTATLSDTVQVDTLVNRLDHAGPVTADNVVNLSEAASGLTLTGRVEAGSTAQVAVFGGLYDAVVDGVGNWSLVVPAGEVPVTEGSVGMVVTATDWAGNTAVINDGFTLDMIAPDTPGIVGYFRQGNGYRNATVETGDDAISIHRVDAGGAVNELDLGVQDNPFTGETDYFFLDGAGRPLAIPDGSQLVVTATDAGGNAASTYVVLDETATQVVNIANPNLGAFNIETIDLRFGDQAQLTLTEAQIRALSENGDTVLVQGGADDRVTITGAQAQGATTVDGQSFDIYTLGNDATVVVDSDIQVVT